MRRMVVLVNGLPAAGKSTLAPPLASALELPLVSKDVIKETHADVLGSDPPPGRTQREWNRQLGTAASQTMWALLGMSAPGAVLENSWHLHELDPAWDPPLKTLNRYKRIDEVISRLGEFDGLVARLALEHALAVRDLIRRVNNLEREIKELVTALAPTLLALPGCGVLSAAKIVGETADITRFKSKDAFARHNGTAPLPVWSGNRERFRLSRAGNRQLNCAIHRIAVTQGRCHPPAKEFLERRMKLGNTRMEAIRAFKRRLSDVVYRDLLADAEHATRDQLRSAA